MKEKVKNRDIRISQADKGGAIVVQDVDKYINEANRQLENKLHYKKISTDKTKTIAKRSNDIVEEIKASGAIDENTHKWAETDVNNVRCHQFYTLPKIHKSLVDTPGRPIVSSVNGPTEKLSKLVDHWLIPNVKKSDSYIQDSTDMLKNIQKWNENFGPFPPETKLVTIDVVGLYTNIPHEDLVNAIKEDLNKNPLDGIPKTDLVLKATDHVLKNNVFTFEWEYCEQIHGTAMGTPMAPTVANLFMKKIEERILKNSPVPVNEELWKRFIDYISLIWTLKLMKN